MTVFYGTTMSKLDSTTPSTPSPGQVHGSVRCFSESVNLATLYAIGTAAPTTTDTIEIGFLPKGSVFLYGVLNTSVTMGASATVAIGIAGTTGKYRTAAVITAQAPEVFGLTPVDTNGN